MGHQRATRAGQEAELSDPILKGQRSPTRHWPPWEECPEDLPPSLPERISALAPAPRDRPRSLQGTLFWVLCKTTNVGGRGKYACLVWKPPAVQEGKEGL